MAGYPNPAIPGAAPIAGVTPSGAVVPNYGVPGSTVPGSTIPGMTAAGTAAPTGTVPFDPYSGANAAYNPTAAQVANQQTLASWLGIPPNAFSGWFGGTTPQPYANPYGTNPYMLPPGTPVVGGVPPGQPPGQPPGTIAAPGTYPQGTSPVLASPTGSYGTNPYPPSIYPQPGTPTGTYPPNMYPTQSPQALFPTGWPTDGTSMQSVQRFCLGPRFRHTWVTREGSDNSLGINDTDVSIAFQIPNFFRSGQPLYILPSFGLHLWDGPNGSTGADLPAQAYSAFGDFGWESDPNQIVGADLGARIGVFSDFETMNSDSLRYMGKALAKVRITPTMLFRLGVIYADRNQIKLLPAGGLLWQPNPNTRWDIFFPEPKLSSYLTTIGKTDWWWYINGYYGGGSWTIKRDDGTSDRIDIDDLRAMVGFEWGQNDLLRTGRRIGFIEAGYVFDRKITYVVDPTDDLDLEDGWVIRAGLAY